MVVIISAPLDNYLQHGMDFDASLSTGLSLISTLITQEGVDFVDQEMYSL